jgi:hypothetical protein
MLATNHVLAGALIGRVVHRPVAAFAVGVASHVAMDALPHWGIDVTAPGAYRRFLGVAAVDGTVLSVALAAMVRRRRPRAEIAGALGALLLDMDKPTAVLGVRQLWPDAVHRLHVGVQSREAPRRWRVDVAAALTLLVGLVVTE